MSLIPALTTISNGDTSDATIAMANWNAIRNVVNGQLDSTNFTSTGTLITPTTHGNLSVGTGSTNTMHNAVSIKLTDAGSYFATDNAEAALQEIGLAIGFGASPTGFAFTGKTHISLTDSFPVTTAHGKSYVPFVAGMFRMYKVSGGIYSNWYPLGTTIKYQTYSADSSYNETHVFAVCDSTNIVIKAEVAVGSTSGFGQVTTFGNLADFSSSTKTSFVVRDTSNAWKSDWDQIEAYYWLSTSGV